VASLLLVDLINGRRKLSGLKITAGERVSLFKGRAGAMDLFIHNETGAARRVRLGLALPALIHSESEDMLVDLPAEAPVAKVEWKCSPAERGRFKALRCYFEEVSPMGFWALRSSSPISTELRVYPNLMAEKSVMAMLFLDRNQLGAHAQRQIGKGRDFEKLREYLPGDAMEDVHWKGTAKRGKPVTKVYQIERTQEVYIAVDCSRLTARQTNEFELPSSKGRDEQPAHTVLDKFITTALLVGIAAERQGDLFGLLTFSDTVHSLIRAKNGKEHFGICRDSLYTLRPRSVTPDFEEVCSAIRLRLRRRALIVFLTALDDPLLAENFMRGLDLISRQHLILVNMIEPAGVAPLFKNRDAQSIPDLYRKLGGHLHWAKLRELQKLLARRGVKFGLASNERLAGEVISQYQALKQRQVL
jgi:uncharacterized protein (DUF58 family)